MKRRETNASVLFLALGVIFSAIGILLPLVGWSRYALMLIGGGLILFTLLRMLRQPQ